MFQSLTMGQNLDSMNQVQPRSKAELLYDIVLATGNVEAIRALFREGASLEVILPLLLDFDESR